LKAANKVIEKSVPMKTNGSDWNLYIASKQRVKP